MSHAGIPAKISASTLTSGDTHVTAAQHTHAYTSTIAQEEYSTCTSRAVGPLSAIVLRSKTISDMIGAAQKC